LATSFDTVSGTGCAADGAESSSACTRWSITRRSLRSFLSEALPSAFKAALQEDPWPLPVDTQLFAPWNSDNAKPVAVQTLLAQDYLPADMVADDDSVLCDPGTVIGAYGDESRYQFPDADDATTDMIVSAPTELPAQAPANEENVRAYSQSSLDLTMQGGMTSGVVYPLAACELATKFRFRNVGGASAGAIAAALLPRPSWAGANRHVAPTLRPRRQCRPMEVSGGASSASAM
jgi:hypothetical protein